MDMIYFYYTDKHFCNLVIIMHVYLEVDHSNIMQFALLNHSVFNLVDLDC